MNKPQTRKRLPVNPSLEHLQKQAKRRSRQDPALTLAGAQHQLARDYGCKNWTELVRTITTMRQGSDQLFNVPHKKEPLRQAARAVDLPAVQRILDAGTCTPHDIDAALAHALWYGGESTWPDRKAIADLLLEHGADPDGQYGSAYGPIVFGTGECIQPDSLQWLIDAGADVSFTPIKTKYGAHCPLSHVLCTYLRGRNAAKHRYIDILLAHHAHIPPEVTPPVLAIHRGDTTGLAQILRGDPALATRRFPDLPFGNILLRGATLLHCAVEFNEHDCITILLKHGADLNARADLIDGIGGQTPVFHTIAVNQGDGLGTLKYLAQQMGAKIDPGVRATWRRHDEVQSTPMTPLEYALASSGEDIPSWKRSTPEEVEIVRALGN